MKVCLSSFILWTLWLMALCPSLALSQENKTNVLNSRTFESLNDEERVGQLLMVGLQGKTLTPATKKWLEDIKPGFIILFKRNIESPQQTSRLIKDTEAFFDQKGWPRPIFSVDQEGGDVVRIPTSPPLPTALALGELGDMELTQSIGAGIGQTLRRLHILMNLAPVLDTVEFQPNSFVQTRSFGKDTHHIYKVTKAFIQGAQSQGVLSTAKHFPGIGDSPEDSHKAISFVKISEEDLKRNLIPYKNLIQDQLLDAVMMTHHVFPKIDSLPATFSKKIISILRDQFRFKNLILTDDIEMAGAKYFPSPEERAIQAFVAGNDVIMVAWNRASQKKAFQGVLQAYRSGRIPKQSVHESVQRILSIKQKTFSVVSRRESEDESLSLKNPQLKEAIDSVLEQKVRQEFAALKRPSFYHTKFAVASSDPAFLKTFSSTTSSRRIFLSKETSPKSIKIRKDELLVFHVNNVANTHLLEKFYTPALKKSLLVVNSRFRGSILPEIPALHVQLKHPELGRAIAQGLQTSELRAPASP